MKTEPNDPVNVLEVRRESSGELLYASNGLTKRELFAAMAMQGVLTSGMAARFSQEWSGDSVRIHKTISQVSIAIANTLIAELNEHD